MSMDVRDTRDMAARPRRGWQGDDINDLRLFLMDVLQIPRHARRFTVTFEFGKAMAVNVDYIPGELAAPRQEAPE